MVLRRIFLKIFKDILKFLNNSLVFLHEKGVRSLILSNLNRLAKCYCVLSLVEIGPVVLQKMLKILYRFRQADGQTDRWMRDKILSEMVTWAFSIGELNMVCLLFLFDFIVYIGVSIFFLRFFRNVFVIW